MTTPPSPLVEFRHYELVDGGADAFVAHFEAHFLASQEPFGMDVVGQFTVAGRDDRFVWVRRFPDPGGRGDALTGFYDGPVWKEFGPRANELMLDFTDVHLLTPDPSGPAFAADHVPHGPADGARPAEAGGAPATTVVAALYYRPAVTPEQAAAMEAALAGASEGAGVRELGRLVTAGVANDYPALPVHEAPVVLWLLADDGDGDAASAVAHSIAAPDRVLRLRPTSRSTLR